MRLLYVCMYQFYIDEDGVYTIPSFGNHFWKKYLEVFEHVHIIGEPLKGYLNKEKLVKLDMTNMSIEILPSNNSPQDWKNDTVIKNKLCQVIPCAEALIIKPASRKGVMAIKIADTFNKTYMIEITGDLYTALKNHTNPLKRIYAPFINRSILSAIRNCKFGVYVTEGYLQRVYPITGKTCGASDAVIQELSEDTLTRRKQMIKAMNNRNEIKIGLVGFYHDSNKGIDTAIEAVALLANEKIKLHILGNGNQEDRDKWYRYGVEKNLDKSQLIFPEPIIGIQNMFDWYDSMDIIILPSRSEGLPRTIVEAFSRACPCITSNVCGLSELCEPRWLHSAGNAYELNRLLSEMISKEDLMLEAATYNFKRSYDFLESVQLKKRIDFMNEYKAFCLGSNR